MGPGLSKEERDRRDLYQERTAKPLYWIIRYLHDNPAISDAELGPYIQHIMYNTNDFNYPYPFPKPPEGEAFAQSRCQFYQSTRDYSTIPFPSSFPPPPITPPTFLSTKSIVHENIIKVLKNFAVVYQPQPLLSLYAFCCHDPIIDPPNPIPWSDRLTNAQKSIDDSDISDADLVKDLDLLCSKCSLEQESKSIFLHILLNSKTTAYTEALVRTAPITPDGENPNSYFLWNTPDGFWANTRPRNQGVASHLDLCSCARRDITTSPLASKFIELGLASSLGIPSHGDDGSETSTWGMMSSLIRKVESEDNIDAFLPGVDVIWTINQAALDINAIAGPGRDNTTLPAPVLTPTPQMFSTREEFWNHLFDRDGSLLVRLVHAGSFQILDYLFTSRKDAMTKLFQTKMDSNPEFLQKVTDFTYPQRMIVDFKPDFDRYSKTTQLLLSFGPILQYFVTNAIDTTSVQQDPVHTSTSRSDLSDKDVVNNWSFTNSASSSTKTTIQKPYSAWNEAINNYTSPTNPLLNDALKPFIADINQRFYGFNLTRYCFNRICTTAIPFFTNLRIPSSWTFVLDEILIPMYQHHQEREQQQLQELPTSPPPPSVPLNPNQPIPILTLPHDISVEAKGIFSGWYFCSHPRRNRPKSLLSPHPARALMGLPPAVDIKKMCLPLIFILLISVDLPLDTVMFPSLFSRRKEYPINLGQVVRFVDEGDATKDKNVITTGDGDFNNVVVAPAVIEGNNHNNNNENNNNNESNNNNENNINEIPLTPISLTPISLTPIQFTIMRWVFSLTSKGNKDIIDQSVFENRDHVDSVLVKSMIDYYIESILDNTVDQVHQPGVIEVHC